MLEKLKNLSMNTTELFKAIFDLTARLLGLYLFYQGVQALGMLGHTQALFIAVIHFAAALLLVRGKAMSWAYPEPKVPKAKAPVPSPAPPRTDDNRF
ncbi:MAG: hypothetical protein WCH84_11255 [Verrucomicrobiota bacterium]